MPQTVKNPPAMQEIWIRSLGWEDPFEKEQLSTPVFWPGEFHGLYSPWSCKESDTTELCPVYISITVPVMVPNAVLKHRYLLVNNLCMYFFPFTLN